MDFESASAALTDGKLVYRTAWPVGTLLVQQGGYKADLSKWNDRSPLSKSVLSSLGITEELEIKAHVDMLANKQLVCGYVFIREDIVATDWEEYQVPVQEAPKQQSGTAEGLGAQGTNEGPVSPIKNGAANNTGDQVEAESGNTSGNQQAQSTENNSSTQSQS